MRSIGLQRDVHLANTKYADNTVLLADNSQDFQKLIVTKRHREKRPVCQQKENEGYGNEQKFRIPEKRDLFEWRGIGTNG